MARELRGILVAIGYRAVLRLDRNQDAIAVAEEQIRTWLRSKAKGKQVEWDGPGHYPIAKNLELLVVHSDHDETTPRRLYRVVDVNPAGRWTVSLYSTALPSRHGNQQTIVVEVDLAGADRESALAKIAPPKVVSSLLRTCPASDGAIALTGTPAVIRSGQIRDVVDAIADPKRMASVVVAVSPARDLDDGWREAVRSLTTQSIGVTAAYVVYADAVDEFNSALPPSHQVVPGNIRTYLPRVALDNPADGFRHKWLTLQTLTRSLTGKRVGEGLQRRHGEAARRRFVEAELPGDVQRMMELLRRAETGIERAARVEARIAEARGLKEPLAVADGPSSAPHGSSDESEANSAPARSWLQRVAGMVKRWLGVESSDLSGLEKLDDFIEAKVAEISVAEEQLSEAAGDVEALQSEVDKLRRERDDMELEWAAVREAQQDADREIGILRQRIATSDRPQDAYVEPLHEDWSAPASVEELLGRLNPEGTDAHPASTRVVFTGDEAGALEIDKRYTTGIYAIAFWQHVRVLYDYAEARVSGFSGGVHVYLTTDTVPGEKVSPKQHAAKESDSTLNNKKWLRERILPVPSEVNPDGAVLMEAHFKPTWRDTFAPRLHYYDDVANSGKIYIGYIGRHLTNSQS